MRLHRAVLFGSLLLGSLWVGAAGMPSANLARAQATPSEVSGLRVYVLDCGTLKGLPEDEFLPGQPPTTGELDLVNRCYLVEHPQGTLLWDAGLPDAASSWLARTFVWLISFGAVDVDLERTLLEQLAEIGKSPADVEYVAFSHLHTDHVGAANAFQTSTWLIQRPELEVAFNEEVEGFDASYYEELEDSERKVLDGDFDVFGDGSVVILSAPGHTPGHQCLFLDLPKRGPTVLSGDLYHTQRNRELRVAPRFNTNAEQSLRSMERIEGFLTERGANLLIQHDPVSNAGVPLSPEYLE